MKKRIPKVKKMDTKSEKIGIPKVKKTYKIRNDQNLQRIGNKKGIHGETICGIWVARSKKNFKEVPTLFKKIKTAYHGHVL